MSKSPSRNRNGRHAPALQESTTPDVKNYMTSQGYSRLKSELTRLLDVERPELVKVISWAASNGDRSENGDYIYGKKRLREIDRRIHYLTKRLDNASVVNPARRGDSDQIFFGRTRMRSFFNFIASDDLRGVFALEIDQTYGAPSDDRTGSGCVEGTGAYRFEQCGFRNGIDTNSVQTTA